MLPGEGHAVFMSLGFCSWYLGANQTPFFNLKNSFASLILGHLATLKGSRVKTRVQGMRDFLELKDESHTTATSHSSSSESAPSPDLQKSSAKRKLDTSSLPGAKDGKHKRPRKRGRGKKADPAAKQVSPSGGVIIREGEPLPRRSARLEASCLSDKG